MKTQQIKENDFSKSRTKMKTNPFQIKIKLTCILLLLLIFFQSLQAQQSSNLRELFTPQGYKKVEKMWQADRLDQLVIIVGILEFNSANTDYSHKVIGEFKKQYSKLPMGKDVQSISPQVIVFKGKDMGFKGVYGEQASIPKLFYFFYQLEPFLSEKGKKFFLVENENLSSKSTQSNIRYSITSLRHKKRTIFKKPNFKSQKIAVFAKSDSLEVLEKRVKAPPTAWEVFPDSIKIPGCCKPSENVLTPWRKVKFQGEKGYIPQRFLSKWPAFHEQSLPNEIQWWVTKAHNPAIFRYMRACFGSIVQVTKTFKPKSLLGEKNDSISFHFSSGAVYSISEQYLGNGVGGTEASLYLPNATMAEAFHLFASFFDLYELVEFPRRKLMFLFNQKMISLDNYNGGQSLQLIIKKEKEGVRATYSVGGC